MAKCKTETGFTAIWWEKTVEYAYLAKSVSEGVQLVPFAGPLERATGDAIEIAGDEFLIIEFKDKFSKSALQQEIAKFKPEYSPYPKHSDALVELCGLRGKKFAFYPHCFASRKVIESKNGKYVSDLFEIEYRDYWALNVICEPIRCSSEDFMIYLMSINEMRAVSRQGEMPQGSIYGFSSDGCIVSVCDLDYVLEALRSGKHLKFTNTEHLSRTWAAQRKPKSDDW